jgi:hypothetical protein
MTFHDYSHAPAHWTTDCVRNSRVHRQQRKRKYLMFNGADPLRQVELHCLCSFEMPFIKLVDLIHDLCGRWGMTFHDYFHAPAHWTTDCWVPDMVWFTCSNANAIVLTFKGADPLWQVNLKADPPISKSYYKSMRFLPLAIWQ